VFVGDYIYEASSPEPVRSHGSPEAVDLAGYRNRYALYKTDGGLQAAHAACPWLVAWDDHEVDNDDAGGAGAGGELAARRAAAYRAWWEHQPVRRPPPDGLPYPVHREVRFGDLARIVLLDTRQYRSDQACGAGLAARCPELDDPARTMLGAEQEAWLAAALPVAPARWDVLAQQVAMTNAEALGQVNTDQWDGYGPARRRLVESLVAAGLRNAIVLSGDLHAALVGDVRLDQRTVATEFVGPSLSSRFPDDLARAFSLLPAVAPAVLWTDATVHGYVVCELTPDSFRSDYRVVASTAATASTIATLASFVVDDGQPGATRL
jgi:alkaline phosphatase D